MNVDEAIRLARNNGPWSLKSIRKLDEALAVLANKVERLRLEYWRATDGGSGDSECQHGVLLTSPCDECAEDFAAFQARKSD